MWRLLLCAFATSVTAQQDSSRDDAKTLLLEVRKKVMLTVNRLPKYTCTETIDRSSFRPETKVVGRSCDDLASRRRKANWKVRQDTSDRLRLDVAVSGDGEMYSWVGEGRFQDRSLADLVRGGVTSTGAFGPFLINIFGTNTANFTYDGDVNIEGRALVEFGFRVPLEESGYRIRNSLYGAIVAYDGTFLVDPKTFDLVRLTVRTDRPPAELNICEDITTLDYSSVRLNNSEFLLPKEVHLKVTYTDGSESDNRTAFAGCHEFLGESSLRFDDASPTEQLAVPKTAVKALVLPAGLPFTLALTRAIDTGTASAGDPIKAKLTGPIKGKDNSVLVPKGAAVTGRIVQIQRLYARGVESLELTLKLETVEANGVSRPFNARLESAIKRRTKSDLVIRQDLGSFSQMSDSEDQDAGFLEFQDVSEHYVINPGLEIEGTTATPK
jgi:hypothetical protein